MVVRWKPCTASLFTIYYREVFSEVDDSYWNTVNASGHETSHDLILGCRKEYEIAITAWDSTSETPLTALNHSKLWRVKTSGGNNKGLTIREPGWLWLGLVTILMNRATCRVGHPATTSS